MWRECEREVVRERRGRGGVLFLGGLGKGKGWEGEETKEGLHDGNER